jgi:nucleoid DNA-binding protein
LLQGKNTSYTGPRNSTEIARLISKEAAERGYNVPDDVAYDIIRHFFDRIIHHMKLGNVINIPELGVFGLSKEKKKEFDKAEEKRIFKYKVNKRRFYRRKSQLDAAKAKWRAFNEKRVANGYSEWSFKDYRSVHKVKIDRRIRRYHPPKKK